MKDFAPADELDLTLEKVIGGRDIESDPKVVRLIAEIRCKNEMIRSYPFWKLFYRRSSMKDFVSSFERVGPVPRKGNLFETICCMGLSLIVIAFAGVITAVAIYMLVGGK